MTTTACFRLPSGLVSLCFLLLCLALGGCATTYSVAIDSLAVEATTEGSYFLTPAPSLGVEADDLLFQEVCALIRPAFAARGMTLADTPEQAAHEVRLSYGMGEPTTLVQTWRYPDYETVFWRGRAFSVRVMRTEVSTRIIYHARLALEARRRQKMSPGRQIWQTRMQVSGGVDDFRKLLSVGVPALGETLGSRTDGVRHYAVKEDRDGTLSISRKE